MEIDRVAVADVERARQSEFLAHADRQDAAVHEHGAAGSRGGDVEQPPRALILNRKAVHRGEQTDCAKPASIDRVRRGVRRSRAGRIDHEEADEASRVTLDRRGDRRRVAWKARNQGRARDA